MTSVPTERLNDKLSPHDRVNDRLRDAWLDELWAPVPEYRAGREEDHTAALARRDQLATFFGDQPIHHHAGDRVRWSGAA